MKYLIIFLLVFCLFNYNFGQYNFAKNYKPITSNSPLPEELNRTGLEKATEKINSIDPKNKEKKVLENFYLNTIIDEDLQMKNGEVLYNTLINDYIEKIADVILKDDPELRKKLSFYPIKSNDSNAWEHDNGHIYISLDYIARFKTEAQIAEVLCHEISHYKNQHHYKMYLKKAEILKKMKRALNKDTLQREEQYFYRTQESTADLEGFELLKKSEYNLNDIPESFDIMLLSEYSFENIPFDISYFNQKEFIINPKIFFKEIKPIHVDANYDDTWDTHPNVYKRKKAIEDELKKDPKPAGKDFIVSQKTFELVRTICRFETALCDVSDGDSPSAVYHAYCLLKQYPENETLKKLIINCLYKMAVRNSYSSLYSGFFNFLGIHDNMKSNINRDSTMGYISQVKRMFKRLSGEDFTLLAINCTYKNFKETGYSDSESKTKLDTLFNILSNIHNFNYKDFNHALPNQQNDEGKKDQYAYQRNLVDAIDRKNAFVPFMRDSMFLSFFHDTISTNEFEIKYISKGRTGQKKELKEGINASDIKNTIVDYKEVKQVLNILVTRPYFTKIKYKKDEIVHFYEDAITDGNYFLENVTSKFMDYGFRMVLLDDYIFDKQDFEKYEMNSKINLIFSEAQGNYKSPHVGSYLSRFINDCKEKFGTPYVMQIFLTESIYDNVEYSINGFYFTKDVTTYDYTFEIINVCTGNIVYNRSLEKNGVIDQQLLNSLIAHELQYISILQQ